MPFFKVIINNNFLFRNATALHNCARRSSDAGTGCKDRRQQSSVCGSPCQPQRRTTLCPQAGCCHGGNAGTETTYSGWNDLAVSANTALKSSDETAKRPRPPTMSVRQDAWYLCPPLLGNTFAIPAQKDNCHLPSLHFLRQMPDLACLGERLLQQTQTEL